tara:strand:+ start:296 stop:505 length:210 start_codon:yes stop_codon:yes gene_type:complete
MTDVKLPVKPKAQAPRVAGTAYRPLLFFWTFQRKKQAGNSAEEITLFSIMKQANTLAPRKWCQKLLFLK